MDKKKILRQTSSEDLKGFEEFLEQAPDESFIDKSGKNLGGESLTFLLNDNLRLKKIAGLVADKIPVLKAHDQAPKIIEHQQNLNAQLKNELFRHLGSANSPLQKSLSEIWNGYFGPEQKKS